METKKVKNKPKTAKKGKPRRVLQDQFMYDFGGWLKDNQGAIMSGLSIAGGAAAMAIPGGQVVGGSLIANGASGLVQDAAQKKQLAAQEEAQNAQMLLKQQELSMRRNQTAAPTFDLGGFLNEFKGPKHEQRGIKIAAGEVEGGETSLNNDYVFSDQLTVPGKKATYAQESKRINSRFYRENDPIDAKSKAAALGKLQSSQEHTRAVVGLSDLQAKYPDFDKRVKKFDGGGWGLKNSNYSLLDGINSPLIPKPAATTLPYTDIDLSGLQSPYANLDLRSQFTTGAIPRNSASRDSTGTFTPVKTTLVPEENPPVNGSGSFWDYIKGTPTRIKEQVATNREQGDYNYHPLPEYVGAATNTIMGLKALTHKKPNFDRVSVEDIDQQTYANNSLQRLDPTRALQENRLAHAETADVARSAARGAGNYMSNRLGIAASQSRGAANTVYQYDNQNATIENEERRLRFQNKQSNAGLKLQAQMFNSELGAKEFEIKEQMLDAAYNLIGAGATGAAQTYMNQETRNFNRYYADMNTMVAAQNPNYGVTIVRSPGQPYGRMVQIFRNPTTGEVYKLDPMNIGNIQDQIYEASQNFNFDTELTTGQ